jgi:DNA end-binding protein Ku
LHGLQAYALLRDALTETKRVGIGTIVIRQPEQLVAVEPAGKTLSLTTMRFPHEIRDSEDLDVTDLREGYGIKGMDLARKLIDTLAADWTPEKYRDT